MALADMVFGLSSYRIRLIISKEAEPKTLIFKSVNNFEDPLGFTVVRGKCPILSRRFSKILFETACFSTYLMI